jgi:hypothetical protein
MHNEGRGGTSVNVSESRVVKLDNFVLDYWSGLSELDCETNKHCKTRINIAKYLLEFMSATDDVSHFPMS